MEISLSQMPKQIKNVLTAFIFTATIGFSIGLFFINRCELLVQISILPVIVVYFWFEG